MLYLDTPSGSFVIAGVDDVSGLILFYVVALLFLHVIVGNMIHGHGYDLVSALTGVDKTKVI